MADIKRLNYFNGQFLKQEDFNDEQGYHIDMRRRLNRSLQTWGVADTGLQVTLVQGANNQISVGAGMALDNQGREIVLLTPQTKNLSSEPANSDVYVTIQYQETKTDPPPNSTDPTLFTRWTELPKIEIVRTQPPADGGVITLAKIRLDASSNVASIDQSVRAVASSKIAPKSNLQVGSLTWGNRSQLLTDQGGSIELGGDSSTAGTGTPYIDFHFNGRTEDFNTRIINDADGMLTLRATTTHTTGKLIADGNVGIGTTNPGSALQIMVPASSNPIKALTVDVDSFGNATNSRASYFMQVRDIQGAPPAGQTHFYIRGDGRVGIGTADPNAQLHVSDTLVVGPIASGQAKGRLEVSGPIAELAFMRRTLTSWPASPVAGDRFLWYNPDGSARLWTQVLGDLLSVSSEGHMSMIGNLSFGTKVRQMINLWSTEYGIGIQSGTQYYRTAAHFAWFKGGAHNDATFNPGTGGTVQMVINSSGNVGIGTANPGGKLEVAGDIRAGNSDIYFTKTDHNHSAFGNNAGFAAIENAKDFEGLMILGRQMPGRRVVKLWDFLQVNGNLEVTGSKSGYVVDRFVNNLDDTLEEGDVVVIGQNQASAYYGLYDNIPVPEVDMTEHVYDTRVCGIVSEVHVDSPSGGNEILTSDIGDQKGVRPRSSKARGKTKSVASNALSPEELSQMERTKVAPGQMGTMVTLGAFAHCKVDADFASIKVGDLLTTSPTKGHAQKVLEPTQAVGAILGKALGSLKKGKGKIPVLVMLH